MSTMRRIKLCVLTLKCPTEHNSVTIWVDEEKNWYHTFFDEKKTESLPNPKAARVRRSRLRHSPYSLGNPGRLVSVRLETYDRRLSVCCGRFKEIITDSEQVLISAVPFSFQFYSSGVLIASRRANTDHGVLAAPLRERSPWNSWGSLCDDVMSGSMLFRGVLPSSVKQGKHCLFVRGC